MFYFVQIYATIIWYRDFIVIGYSSCTVICCYATNCGCLRLQITLQDFRDGIVGRQTLLESLGWYELCNDLEKSLVPFDDDSCRLDTGITSVSVSVSFAISDISSVISTFFFSCHCTLVELATMHKRNFESLISAMTS
jgi:hypothetical protein